MYPAQVRSERGTAVLRPISLLSHAALDQTSRSRMTFQQARDGDQHQEGGIWSRPPPTDRAHRTRAAACPDACGVAGSNFVVSAKNRPTKDGGRRGTLEEACLLPDGSPSLLSSCSLSPRDSSTQHPSRVPRWRRVETRDSIKRGGG